MGVQSICSLRARRFDARYKRSLKEALRRLGRKNGMLFNEPCSGTSKGNTMSDRAYAKAQAPQKTLIGSSPKSSLLQRTCACGQHTIAGGECDACRSEQSTWHHSQRAFEPPSAPVAGQGNAPAQEHGPSFNAAFDRASRFGH